MLPIYDKALGQSDITQKKNDNLREYNTMAADDVLKQSKEEKITVVNELIAGLETKDKEMVLSAFEALMELCGEPTPEEPTGPGSLLLSGEI